ncbi:hypothetical protein BDQ12DRAFT_675273 [Crucibulum laeve]|uniref:Sjogrens syndrome scleroderma autoantigen 1 family protein n=1 Tax=Crucibulum laeve TaxID=68775 RepID=A0A5C3MDY8_9AGAR|nr:hypothetical protein BDQ12DRAFT_675273 [Crucibulum laeve]
MSSVADVSGILGEYMLKGWVLTDKSCPTPGCAVPLMRSPKGRMPTAHFCANCDGSPDFIQRTTTNPFVSNTTSSSNSDASQMSRSSTPPTEVSEALSSPVFAPPVETEESRRRREQSDRASSEIGRRLLKGWAMLADECPNAGCFGVPLVRPPKVGGETDPRKECVICGSVYITEIDWAGRERLILADTGARRSDASASTSTPTTQDKGKSVEVIPPANIASTFLSSSIPSKSGTSSHAEISRRSQAPPSSNIALDDTARALQSTLQALSVRLTSLSTSTVVDPATIGSTADAITKVAMALSNIINVQNLAAQQRA